MSRIIDALLFAFVYAAILGSGDPLDWLIGAVIGALLPRANTGADLRGLFGLSRFVLGMSAYVLRGSLRMLRVLIGAKRAGHCGYVALPFGERTPSGATVTAFVATAAPGTALAEFDPKGRRLILNALDADDPAAIIDPLEDFYRRSQRRLFP